MTSMRLAALSIAAVALCSCATSRQIPYRPTDFRGALTRDIGVPESAVVAEGRCEIGWLRGFERSANVQPCLYVATRKRVLFLDFDADNKKYREIFRIDGSSLTGAALKTRGRAVQIQGVAGNLVYVFARTSPTGNFYDIPATTAAYEHLKSLGIPEIEARPYIPAIVQPSGPIIIPIYVGR